MIRVATGAPRLFGRQIADAIRMRITNSELVPDDVQARLHMTFSGWRPGSAPEPDPDESD